MIKATVETKVGVKFEFTAVTIGEAVDRFVRDFYNDYIEVHFTNVNEEEKA